MHPHQLGSFNPGIAIELVDLEAIGPRVFNVFIPLVFLIIWLLYDSVRHLILRIHQAFFILVLESLMLVLSKVQVVWVDVHLYWSLIQWK